ncbi:YwaF family protein [Antribacter gilvus]|uniref:TMEM164 family acyltransferase n=1 Tax=Antribacter gilvus TaxID=2304675 RepID=UPI000F77D272|nr:YwaF family protein [Antribacter gilvus]
MTALLTTTSASFLPVTPLNGVWTGFVVAMVLLAVMLHLLLRHRPAVVRRRALLGMALANACFSLTFHVAYLTDPAVHFPLFQNLPLHLCTIVSVFLLPLAVRFDWRPLRAVVFFPGAVAGALALISCAPMYWGHPLLSLKTFFFVAHALNAVLPALLASLGLYRPTVRDAVLSLGYTIVLALCVLPVTIALRTWVDPGANYFYVFDPEGAAILVLFHDLIGIPLVYELPVLLVVLPVLLLQVAVYRGGQRLAARRYATGPAGRADLPGLTRRA